MELIAKIVRTEDAIVAVKERYNYCFEKITE